MHWYLIAGQCRALLQLRSIVAMVVDCTAARWIATGCNEQLCRVDCCNAKTLRAFHEVVLRVVLRLKRQQSRLQHECEVRRRSDRLALTSRLLMTREATATSRDNF